MEYTGEYNILKRVGEDYIQIPTGLKEKGLHADNIMTLVREFFNAKELDELSNLESISASYPLKKKTTKEITKKIAEEAVDQGISFLVDTLIEVTLDIDMSTNPKDSLFSELVSHLLNEEERDYLVSIGKYQGKELFFESVLPISEEIRSSFHTKYEADFFVAHVSLNSYRETKDFFLKDLEKAFQKWQTDLFLNQEKDYEFYYQGVVYPMKKNKNSQVSYNLFTMNLILA